MSEFLLNPVLLAVVILLILSVARLNVTFSLIIASLCGGLIAKISCTDTMKIFANGLGNGAQIAFSYAMLGAFSIAVSRSGVTELVANQLFKYVKVATTPKKILTFKYSIIAIITIMAVFSQNVIPVHIAFIPVLIPPLLHVFQKVKLDRRLIACALTFGLITPYMFLPIGFGKIYLNEVLLGNLAKNGLQITADMAPKAMFIPALGMIAGLLIAIFISYRKPREYKNLNVEATEAEIKPISKYKVIVGIIAIIIALFEQIFFDSLVIASLSAIAVFVIARVIAIKDTQDVFTHGVYLMGGIGIVMIAASGFAEVMKATGGIEILVNNFTNIIGNNRALAVFLMLLIGLIITMGIGSSFSTVPLIAAIYVPLCMQLEISTLATVSIVGVAGALGDAGSPVSESVLGPTAGLNADGQHDHIYDSTIPTFLHYNIPLLIAGWIAGMIL